MGRRSARPAGVWRGASVPGDRVVSGGGPVFGDADPLWRGKAPLPVREHLAELLGVTPMLEAAAVLRTAQAAAAQTVAGLRAEAAGSKLGISEAETAVASAQERQSEVLAER